MSYFFLYNPKYADPGSVVTHFHPDWIKRKKKIDEEPFTEELKEKAREFVEIQPKIKEIKETVRKKPELFLDYLFELQKEAELARLLLEMEEEELAAIILLLED